MNILNLKFKDFMTRTLTENGKNISSEKRSLRPTENQYIFPIKKISFGQRAPIHALAAVMATLPAWQGPKTKGTE